MKKLAIFLSIALIAIAPTVYAADWQPAGDKWIEKWWALDLVIRTGGFGASAAKDYLAEGTVDVSTNESVYTNQSVSTREGAGLTGRAPVRLPAANGGILTWSVVNLNINSTNNMYQSHDIPNNAPGHLRDNITCTVSSSSCHQMTGLRRYTQHTMTMQKFGSTVERSITIQTGLVVLHPHPNPQR